MRGTESWNALRQVIAHADRFFLTSHVFPEGDAIGSEVALAMHLKALGKEVLVLNDGPALDRYGFLTRLFPILSWNDQDSWPDPGWMQVAICLDVSSWDYLGGVGRWLKAARRHLRIVTIDHHHKNGRFGDLDVVVEDASSTGEILYRYFRAVGAPLTVEMAEALYASILFDTWGLRLPNAGNETVRLVAELLAHGVDHRQVCANLFERESLAKFDLLRLALATLRSACGGRLAWLAIPDDLFRATGTRFSDGDGVLDHLLGLRDAEICVLFRQQEDRGVKVTFRSKGHHDVGRLAEELGGGGRGTASGVLLPVTIHQAMESVLPRLHEMLGEPMMETGIEAGGSAYSYPKISRAVR